MLGIKITKMSKLTVKTLAEKYLFHVHLRLKNTSFSTYQRIINKHITPVFGDALVETLTYEDIDKFFHQLSFPENNAHLSSATIRGIATVLRNIFSYAKELGYKVIEINRDILPKKCAKQQFSLSESDCIKLQNFCVNHIEGKTIGILISLRMGLRLGEVCALQWKDVDVANQTLEINQTAQRIIYEQGLNGNRKTELSIGSPKTNSSKRRIPIPTDLFNLFLKHKDDSDLYIVSGTSYPKDPRTMQRNFSEILRQAGINAVNFHTLRHTFATRCTIRGVDPKTIAEILGHTNANITLSTYVHSSLSQKRMAVEVI